MYLYYLYFYDDIDNPYICSTIRTLNYIIRNNYRVYFFNRKLKYGIDYYVERELINETED